LKRYFKAVNNINIINGKEFDEANSVYKAQCTALKKNGLAKTEHKPAIADEDITKLYEAYSTQKLQLPSKTRYFSKLCSTFVVEVDKTFGSLRKTTSP
jgi:hypothetical protein